MKKYYYLSTIIAGFVLLSTSCSKEYGYNFENGYSSGIYEDTVKLTIDTNRFKIDYTKYAEASLFPGLVGEKEPRLTDHKVAIDLDFVYVPSSDLRISVTPGAWQGTRMYAPAGELIIIDVPAGVYGLTAQIGAWTDTDPNKDIANPQRDRVIISKQTLFPGRNFLRNLYGGLVYIIPTRPLGRTIDLSFTGTVLAPSFKLGETTDQEWADILAKTTVPWFDLEGDRIVFTLPIARLKKYPIPSPTALMRQWDKQIKEVYWDWTGMTEGNPNPKHRAPFNKWRVVHDILLKPGVAQHSGYPVVAGATDSYFKQATQLNDVMFANWGTYHELGHNMQQGSTWSFAGNGEVTNNLFSFKASLLNGRQSYKIAEVWATSAVAWINKAPGANKVWPISDEKAELSQDGRLMMYAQIFEYFSVHNQNLINGYSSGYDFMTYIYIQARNARFTSASNQAKIDFFYEALSQFAKQDMLVYLRDGWGIIPSSVSANYVKNTLQLPAITTKIWLFNPVTKTGGDQPI